MITQIVSTSYLNLLRSAHAFSSLTPHKQTLLLHQGFNVLMYAVQKQLADTKTYGILLYILTGYHQIRQHSSCGNLPSLQLLALCPYWNWLGTEYVLALCVDLITPELGVLIFAWIKSREIGSISEYLINHNAESSNYYYGVDSGIW